MVKLKAFIRSKVFLGFVAGFLILPIAVATYLLIIKKERLNTVTPIETNSSEVLAETAPIEEIGDLKQVGILLLGYGGAGHEGGYLTDVLQVMVVDFENNKIYFISIPRDLYVKLPSGAETKINGALTRLALPGSESLVSRGSKQLKPYISSILGLPIHYFVGIDFVGFQRAIGGNLKGIDVEVHEELDDPWYPITGEEQNICGMSPEEMKDAHEMYSGFELERQFKCRYKRIHYEKGTHRMEGGDALAYVRSRHGSSEGDISRGKRQQEVLIAIRKKLFSLEALEALPDFFSKIVTHMETDINSELLLKSVTLLKQSQNFEVIKINLSTSNVLQASNSKSGGAIIIPKSGLFNWNDLQEYIKNEMN